MKYSIGQSTKLHEEKENFWNWSLWIDASESDLDQIDYVEYILHSTFPNRVRRRSSRKNKYKLDSSGWGEFNVFIRIYFKDNSEALYLTHYLQLFSQKEPNDSQMKKAFVSFQLRDEFEVESLQDELKQNNVSVISTKDLESSKSLHEEITSSIDDSQLFILYASNYLSKAQEFELDYAINSEKPIYVIGNKVEISQELKKGKKFNDSEAFLKYMNKT